MSIFYNIRHFRGENIKHLTILICLYLGTFAASLVGVKFFIPSGEDAAVWQTLKAAPIIFGTLTYVVLGITLSYLTYKGLAQIICFTAVVTDNRNKRLVNALLFNLLLLNIFASVLIAGYIGMYFWPLSTSATHILYLLLSSLIIPITYCTRILECCVDRIVNLEAVVENSCMRFIKIPD